MNRYNFSSEKKNKVKEKLEDEFLCPHCDNKYHGHEDACPPPALGFVAHEHVQHVSVRTRGVKKLTINS
jgi:hypothetical protein